MELLLLTHQCHTLRVIWLTTKSLSTRQSFTLIIKSLSVIYSFRLSQIQKIRHTFNRIEIVSCIN